MLDEINIIFIVNPAPLFKKSLGVRFDDIRVISGAKENSLEILFSDQEQEMLRNEEKMELF